MLILMVYVSLFHYTGSGPNWLKEGPEVNHCEKAWYYNILYINNFFDDRENSVRSLAKCNANICVIFVIDTHNFSSVSTRDLHKAIATLNVSAVYI